MINKEQLKTCFNVTRDNPLSEAMLDHHVERYMRADEAIGRIQKENGTPEDYFTVGMLYELNHHNSLDDYKEAAEFLIVAHQYYYPDAKEALEHLLSDIEADTSYRSLKLNRHMATDDGIQGSYDEQKLPAKTDLLNDHLNLVNKIRAELGIDGLDLQDIPIISS